MQPLQEALPDTILWDHFLQGDEEAYSIIYKKYVKQLFHYGTLFTPDDELVKDAIQDLFIKIYNNRKRLGKTDNILLYLSAALKNSILNTLQKDQTRSYHLDTFSEENTEDTEHSPEARYIEQEIQKETNLTIKHIFENLTIRQREIIYYRFIKDMSIDEISKITNMNYQSVSNIIQRSLSRIRIFFKKNEK